MSPVNNANQTVANLQNTVNNATAAAQADTAAGNTAQASQDMNQAALANLGIQEESAIEGMMQDTIKAIIQNESKA